MFIFEVSVPQAFIYIVMCLQTFKDRCSSVCCVIFTYAWLEMLLEVRVGSGPWVTINGNFYTELALLVYLPETIIVAHLLRFSRVRSQQHRSQTSAASSEHCTPKHHSFKCRQQLCLLPPQHQAWIFKLYRQLCASVRALQPHEPRHWQWPFTSGQSVFLDRWFAVTRTK